MMGLNREIKYRDFFEAIDHKLLLKILDVLKEDKQTSFYKSVQSGHEEAIIKAYEELQEKKNNPIVQTLQEINDFDTELYILNQSEFNKLHGTLKDITSKSYKAFKTEPKEINISEEELLDLQKEFVEKIKKEEYGDRIKIENYSLSDRTILTYWLEDYTKDIKKFDEESDGVVNHRIRPLQEATLIYYPEAGTVQIKAKNNSLIEATRKSFAKICFKNEELFEGKECSVCVDLDKLKTLEEFSFDPAKIHEINLTGMKVKILKGIPATLELKSKDDIFKQFNYRNIDVREDDKVKIIKIWIQFKFVKAKHRQKTITLSTPNHIGIDNTEVGNIIRKTLDEWGLIN